MLELVGEKALREYKKHHHWRGWHGYGERAVNRMEYEAFERPPMEHGGPEHREPQREG